MTSSTKAAPARPRTDKWINRTYHKSVQLFQAQPYISTFLLCVLFMMVFQFPFVSSGDNWAETFYEYVHGAVANGTQGFFYTGIAGYFNFLPKLFSYGYVLAGLPLQYIDYFLRATTILFAISCISFIAHSYNRHLIRNDLLRLLLSISTLMTYYHVSSFSFINVWYVGFIPIILVSIHPNKFKHEWQQVIYATFAMSVCLTKPSLILLPLVIYRAVRHKEYLLGSIITFAIGLQSLLFLTSTFYNSQPPAAHVDIMTKLANTLLYCGLLFVKLFELYTVHFITVALASLLLFLLVLYFMKVKSWLQGMLLTLTMLLSAYTAIYSPDTAPVSILHNYNALLLDEMKLQREVIIYFFILLFTFVAAFSLQQRIRERSSHNSKSWLVIPSILLVLAVLVYRPIDTRSSNIFIDIDPFRTTLKTNTPTCMPIPPTPSWVPYNAHKGPTYGWYYENGAFGDCFKTNYDKTPEYTTFTRTINGSTEITLTGKEAYRLSSLLIPVLNPTPSQAHALVLRDMNTKQEFQARIVSKSNGDMYSFVAFNLYGENPQDAYNFTLSEKDKQQSELRLGKFADGTDFQYAYFLPYTKPQK